MLGGTDENILRDRQTDRHLYPVYGEEEEEVEEE